MPGLLGDLAWRILEFVPRPVQVASSLSEGSATLLRGDAQPRRLLGHTAPIVDIKFFPGGDRIVTAGADGVAIVWSAPWGHMLQRLQPYFPDRHDRLLEVQVFPDGERVVTLGQRRAVVWAAATGETILTIHLAALEQHRSVRVCSRGERIVTGVSHALGDPMVVWSTANGGELHRLRQPNDRVRFMELSPDGERLVSAGFRGVFIWNTTWGLLERELDMCARWVSGVAITDSAQVLVGSLTGRLLVWDGAGQLNRTLQMGSGVLAFAPLPGDRIVALTASEAVVWHTASGRRLRALEGAGGAGREAQRIAAAPDGRVVAACGSVPRWWGGARAVVWDADSGRRLREIENQDPAPTADSWNTFRPSCSIAVGPAGSAHSWLAA